MWAGRAADRFDAAVGDDAARGDAAPAELLALVSALRDLPEVAPRREHSVALRERLMVEADRLAASRTHASPDPSRDGADDRLRLRVPRRNRRRLAVLAGTVAALGASTSVAVAAQTALPGESLYPVKRALEDVRAGATTTDGAHGRLLLTNAADRLTEVSALLDSGDPASLAEVAPTLDSFTAQATDGATHLLDEYTRSGERDVVRDLRDFTAFSSADLDDMAVDLPPSARDAWSRAVAAVDGIDDDARDACPLCIADPTGFEAAPQLPVPSDPTTLPTTDGSAVPGDGRAGPDGDRGRDGRRNPQDPDVRPGGEDGTDGSGGGSDDDTDGGRGPGGGAGDPEAPSTPRVPDSDRVGDGLGDALDDGLASGLGDGLGSGLRDGLRDGLGGLDGSSREGRKGRSKGGSKGRGGSGSGSDGGLDDLLP